MTAQQLAQPTRLARIHALLGVQTLVVLLVSLNRLGPWTEGYVAPNQFLRWVDLINMLPLPLLSVLAFVLLKHELLRPVPAVRVGRAGLLLDLSFVMGVYLLAVSYGLHELTNYLHLRFCGAGSAGDLCRIVAFNDDDFSHWLFFAGFTQIALTLMAAQVLSTGRGPLRAADFALLVLNALAIAAGIVANLAFEAIGFDLYVVALIAAVAALLLWRAGPRPLLVYYSIGYGLGLLGTALLKLVSR